MGYYDFKVVTTEDHPVNSVYINAVNRTTGEHRVGITNEKGEVKIFLGTAQPLSNVDAQAQPPVGFMCIECRYAHLRMGKVYEFILKEVAIKQTSIIRGLYTSGDRIVGRTLNIIGRLESGTFQRLRDKEIRLIVNGSDSGISVYTGSFGEFALAYILKKSDAPEVVFDVVFPGDEKYGTSSRSITVVISEDVDCYAYGLLSGETICMDMDLWKCENGEMVKIEENSPECKEVKPKGPVCPIACVCMGTPLIDQLGPIREFRDEVLKRSRAGLIFVSLYYGKLSPHLSPLLEKSETLRRAGRILVRGILWIVRK